MLGKFLGVRRFWNWFRARLDIRRFIGYGAVGILYNYQLRWAVSLLFIGKSQHFGRRFFKRKMHGKLFHKIV